MRGAVQIHEALAALEQGDADAGARGFALAEAAPDPEARRAYRAAIAAGVRLSGGAAAAPPDEEDEVRRLGGRPGCAPAALRACELNERAAILTFDRAALCRWVAIHREIAGGQPDGPRQALEVAGLWLALFDGAADLPARAAALREEAARTRTAGVVVEATVLEALARLPTDVPAGLAAARRASRMAAVEEIPSLGWLAAVVLGRCRRFAGRPQVASRILALVAREAHAGWRSWLAWELALAGGARLPAAPPQAQPEGSPAAGAAAALDAALTAARDGDRAAFDGAAAALGARVEAVGPYRDEALDLLAALDLRRPASARLEDWAGGRVAAPPGGLQGVAAPTPAGATPGEATPHGFPPEVYAGVAATAGAPGRRVLRAGVALLDGEPAAGPGPPSRPVSLPVEEARQTRSAAALAALALAGPEGLGRAELFRQVYGFPFNPRLHAGLFDVLAHRARTAAASIGAVERRGEWIALRLAGPCVLPDPRCAIDTQDQLLACLARMPRASTEALARALGLPVRTARAALRQLVADGACAERREGRHVYYDVQDTTFEASGTRDGRPP